MSIVPRALTLLGILLLTLSVQAQSVNNVSGYVYTRALVYGETGKPILAEYDDKGQIVSERGEMVEEREGARILSVALFRLTFRGGKRLFWQLNSD